MDLSSRLATLLDGKLPGGRAQRRFEPDLAFGRHTGPPAFDARDAAVVVLLYPVQGQPHLPLIVRPSNATAHPGQISLPGGAVEPGETSAEAALRELEEELGVAACDVTLAGRLSEVYLFVSNFRITPWVAIADSRPVLNPSPLEVAEMLEVPLAHLCDPANIRQTIRTHRAITLRAASFVWNGHQVWGATSMILGELVELLAPTLP
jgi:8-oxo-dGTP pyrophosphatase MutT (NUDIX family)